ncbi:MAG: DUF4189 domain-containing protein [Rhizobiaceae bacterium]
MKLQSIALTFLLTLAALPSAHADDSKWGVIAIDAEQAEDEPFYGVGGGATEQEATDAALSFCKEAGGVSCKVFVSYEQCGALAVTGDGTVGWGKDTTKELAEAQALKGCEDPAKCKIVVSDCNGG